MNGGNDLAEVTPVSRNVALFIDAGDGRDRIDASGRILGGDGNDVIAYRVHDALPESKEQFFFVDGGEGRDRISGGGQGFELHGGAGDDVLEMGPAARFPGAVRVFDGGSGDDKITGSPDDDVLIAGAGADLLLGGAGDDLYRLSDPLAEITEYEGSGRDVVYAPFGMILPEHVEDYRLIGETAAEMIGNSANNRFWGNAAANAMIGAAGDDTLRGRAGDDVVQGGAGNDTVKGEDGDDVVMGGDGDDRVIGGDGADELWGGFGRDKLWGGQGGDTYVIVDLEDIVKESGSAEGEDIGLIRVDGYKVSNKLEQVIVDIEEGVTVLGSRAKDSIQGGVGDDLVKGGGNNDLICGGEGADVLRGQTGYDTLKGEGGDDVLVGAEGRDHLYGGEGADRFVLGEGSDLDRVYDFVSGEDLLDLRGFHLPDFAALQALARVNADGDVVFEFGGGDMLKLYGAGLADVAETDVLL